MNCNGVIPGTFIMCGEGGNYCSDECLNMACKDSDGLESFADRLLFGDEWSEIRDIGEGDILRVRNGLLKVRDEARLEGAAVAFGIVGWGMALQQYVREQPRRELDAWYEEHMKEAMDRNREVFLALAPHDTRDPNRPGWMLCGCCQCPVDP